MYSTTAKHMADILSNKPNRILIVGGAGSLYSDASHKTQLVDSEGFPDAFVPLAKAVLKSFNELQARKNVNWTYFSPAGNFDVNGPRTGKYQLGGDEVSLEQQRTKLY